MTKQTNIVFMKWLDDQLEQRGWSDNQLAKKAEVNSSSISRVRSGSSPGYELSIAIAKALDVQDVFVLRMVGLLKLPPEWSAELEEWSGMFEKLGSEDRQELIQIARLKIEKGKKRGRQKS